MASEGKNGFRLDWQEVKGYELFALEVKNKEFWAKKNALAQKEKDVYFGSPVMSFLPPQIPNFGQLCPKLG